MNKFFSAVVAFACAVLLSACSLASFELGLSTDNQKANARMEQIAAAVNNHDAAALKAMFSTRALEDAADIDERLDYLLSFFPNGGLRWELELARSSGHNSFGKKTLLVHARYTVSADGSDFFLYFTDFTLNQVEDPENVGLYGLGVTPWTETTSSGPTEPFAAWDGSIHLDGNGEYGYPGVYVPPDNNQLSLLTLSKIIDEVNSQDNLGLRHKFTEHAQAEYVAHIDDGIAELYGLFPYVDPVSGEARPAWPVVRESDETLLLLSSYRVRSREGDYWLFFADFRQNTMDPSNVGIYAIGVAPWTKSGDSPAEQALFSWADSFDVDATVPPGILISREPAA